jgi:hypothetical protein
VMVAIRIYTIMHIVSNNFIPFFLIASITLNSSSIKFALAEEVEKLLSDFSLELLRNPYFNPVYFLAVAPFYSFKLSLFERGVRQLGVLLVLKGFVF